VGDRGTDQFADWFGPLSRADKVRVEAAIERLEEEGPGLGRPWWTALSVEGEGTQTARRLSPDPVPLRPRKTGILLMAGNKEGLWEQWYKTAIPEPRGSTKPTSPNCGEKDY